MHLHPKGFRTARHGLPDPTHPQNAQAAPFNPATQHGCRRPAAPTVRLRDTYPFGHAAGHGQNQRDHDIGGIFSHDTGRVRHMDAPLTGGCHINVVHTGTKVGDQLQLLTSAAQKLRIDLIGDRTDQNIRTAHCIGQLFGRHRRVVITQFDVEKLFQSGFDNLRQPSRHDNTHLLTWHPMHSIAFQILSVMAGCAKGTRSTRTARRKNE